MSDTDRMGPHDAPEPSEDGRGGRRLPPPAFPPGSRRLSVHRGRAPGTLDDALISPDDPIPERSGVPDEAFISPDDPFVRAGGVEDAFISPDEPIPFRLPRQIALAEEGDLDPDEVVVTGIGDDPHLDPDELALSGDPHVLELVEQVGKLAQALRSRGEAGLKSTPEMSRFEATLRAYCVGYLAGRRAESERD